ncbi:MAG TPA: ABC transporter ATP-binding protein [Bacteroidota bacterium]|nr:ABC transporter ATP-binding protein [Bacteroidota bacterium]
MTYTAVEATNLVKIYKPGRANAVRALDGVSLTIQQGEIFGLLGRNGAGKTTLLRILTTLIPPTEGSARVMGFDVQRQGLDVRKHICTVLQENALEMFLSVSDNLTTYARFHSVPSHEREKRAREAMERFGLTEHSTMKVLDLSGGLKRRLQVAKVFMVEKPVVFLDEATTGMDPINKRAVLEAIREQARKGRTIVLTTHILQEAEELCDRIAMIHKGKIIATGDVNAIKALASNVFEVSLTFERLTDEIIRSLESLNPVRMTTTGATVDVRVNGVETELLETITALSRQTRILHVEINGGTLEDAFVELLGDGLSERQQ